VVDGTHIFLRLVPGLQRYGGRPRRQTERKLVRSTRTLVASHGFTVSIRLVSQLGWPSGVYLTRNRTGELASLLDLTLAATEETESSACRGTVAGLLISLLAQRKSPNIW